jgi:hypothetical protein
MSRIRSVTNVEIIEEAVAPKTTILWNPTNNDGLVLFECQLMRWVDDEYQGMRPDRTISVPLADLLPRVFNVETPDGVVPVPAALVMLTLKKAFDVLYVETAVEPEEEAPVAPGSPRPGGGNGS